MILILIDILKLVWWLRASHTMSGVVKVGVIFHSFLIKTEFYFDKNIRDGQSAVEITPTPLEYEHISHYIPGYCPDTLWFLYLLSYPG